MMISLILEWNYYYSSLACVCVICVGMFSNFESLALNVWCGSKLVKHASECSV